MRKHVTKYDRINLNDMVNGWLQIYKNRNLIFKGKNHIVKSGANWLMQRFTNVDYSLDNAKSQWLPRWFSIGRGGATMDHPFDPLVVNDVDSDLIDIIKFNELGGASYDQSITRKLIDSVEYVEEVVTKFTMTIEKSDAVDEYINEAGIYISPSSDTNETHFTLFSRITFPTIPKSGSDELVLEWYFIF